MNSFDAVIAKLLDTTPMAKDLCWMVSLYYPHEFMFQGKRLHKISLNHKELWGGLRVRNGRIFVADRYGNGCTEINDKGDVIRRFSVEANCLNGMDVDLKRNMAFFGNYNSSVEIHSLATGESLGALEGTAKNPNGVLVDSEADRLYVSNSGSRIIQVFEISSRKKLFDFGLNHLQFPQGMVIYGGELYIADDNSGKVHLYTPDGEFKKKSIDVPSGGPVHITAGAGFIYVATQNGKEVYVFRAADHKLVHRIKDLFVRVGGLAWSRERLYVGELQGTAIHALV